MPINRVYDSISIIIRVTQDINSNTNRERKISDKYGRNSNGIRGNMLNGLRVGWSN